MIKKPLSTVIVTLSFCFLALSGHANRSDIVTAAGNSVGHYANSYALLVGVSDYDVDWPDLDAVPSELQNVEALLLEQGFNVAKVMNPDSDQLQEAFENFIDLYGYIPNNRLLFYYSGHGYTRAENTKGYLVPTDAPNPQKDERGFIRKAYSMTSLLALARQIESHHALFLFDSCFSGTIFKTRALPTEPLLISQLTALPVRQFITAGQAGEEVPAKSTFTPAFIDSIKYGLADLNSDGYVTGSELGMHLQSVVSDSSYGGQTPQYGKINDYELARGDFVFGSRSASQNQLANQSRKSRLDLGLSGTRSIVNIGEVTSAPRPVLPKSSPALVKVVFEDAHGNDFEWKVFLNGELLKSIPLSQHLSFLGRKELSSYSFEVEPGNHTLAVRDADDQHLVSEYFAEGKSYEWRVRSSNLMGNLKTIRFSETK